MVKAPPPRPDWLAGVPGAVHVTGDIWDVNVKDLGPSWVGPYDQLVRFVKQSGLMLDAAHIVGREHLLDLRAAVPGDKAPSIAVHPDLHKIWTSLVAGRQSQELGGRATSTHARATVTSRDVVDLYVTVYEDFPELRRIVQDVVRSRRQQRHVAAPASRPRRSATVDDAPPGAPPAAPFGRDSSGASPRADRATDERGLTAPARRQSPAARRRIPGAARSAAVEVLQEGIVKLQEGLNDAIIRRSYDDLKPKIAELRRAGRWVAVFAVYDTPNDRDLLRGVDPTIDEIAVGVTLHSGRTKEAALSAPVPTVGTAGASRVQRIPRAWRGRGRHESLAVLPPYDAQPDDPSLLGRYVIARGDGTAQREVFPMSRSLRLTKGNAMLFEAEFRSTDNQFPGLQQRALLAIGNRTEPIQYHLRFVRSAVTSPPDSGTTSVRVPDFLTRDSPYQMVSSLRVTVNSGQPFVIERFSGSAKPQPGVELFRSNWTGSIVWIRSR